jgi:F-type H+-transporting ATPase subunit b
MSDMKMGWSKYRAILGIAAFVLFSASMGFAAEEAGGEHGSPVMEWVWKIVNFGILVFILVKFAGKPLKGFLAKRTEMIERSLKEAQEAKALAQKALDEVRERLKAKDREMEEIMASARESGEREREALLREGERMGQKVLEQAKTNIDFEFKQAREALKAEAAELAMDIARKKLEEKMTPEVRKKLFEESLAKLEGKK